MVGGTPFDAQLGAHFLQEKGIACTPIGLNPKPQQTADLYLRPNALQNHFEKKVQPAQFSEVLIYCNSLSFATPWPTLYPGKIWALQSLYQNILRQGATKKTLAITAERLMQNHLQKLAKGLNIAKNLKVEAHFDLVKSLEKLNAAQQIDRIKNLLTKCKAQGYAQVIFACTHFDNPVFSQYQGLEIIQPGLQLLEQFEESYTAVR